MDFLVGLGCGVIAGVLIGVVLAKATEAPKVANKEDPDDWWKRGEPAPWEQQ